MPDSGIVDGNAKDCSPKHRMSLPCDFGLGVQLPHDVRADLDVTLRCEVQQVMRPLLARSMGHLNSFKANVVGTFVLLQETLRHWRTLEVMRSRISRSIPPALRFAQAYGVSFSGYS
jgi:hypothetical protein